MTLDSLIAFTVTVALQSLLWKYIAENEMVLLLNTLPLEHTLTKQIHGVIA